MRYFVFYHARWLWEDEAKTIEIEIEVEIVYLATGLENSPYATADVAVKCPRPRNINMHSLPTWAMLSYGQYRCLEHGRAMSNMTNEEILAVQS